MQLETISKKKKLTLRWPAAIFLNGGDLSKSNFERINLKSFKF